ncbi:flagellar basal body rod modification protein [Pseudoxanthomonas broegbernensis]|uniref:Basal-body rod modification protein FlgD n=1 Tax=Pseudoxanthomonas broegbernensis TaxID=83619 RepID=A0A7V8K6S6_9GAMM|nr:flagellar hook capping FlgD N-terminal domain-containing protein [Pseudoxanthomonas broegbernensis]KAF1685580.1 flagellar basal body rod modification protein [Pseudoxanthomonas broegbernensis]MBB6065952.1 flagellar basal-body rod modification protein FlgD [Pseudoxanthomonas broegbernensis]
MSSIASDVYSSLGLSAPQGKADKKNDALGQADFLRLMTEQLQHQDPLKPMENSAFLGQLAQFSTVQGIQELNTQVQGFSASLGNDQVLRGAALVGHEVLVPSSKLSLEEDGSVRGAVAAPGSGNVVFEVTDANGQKVHEFTVAATKAGEVAFAWDGTGADGERLAAGSYGIGARHVAPDGTATKLDTYVKGRVDSVTVGTDGLYLDLPGLGTVPLDYVLRVS